VIVLLFWFVLQLLNGTASFVADATSGGGVAYWAHIGGFLAGMMLIGLFARRSDAGGSHREPTAERW
jgi:membrane associated rhomboid family serine protease